MIGMIPMTVLHQMVLPGLMSPGAPTGWSVAAAGTAMRANAGLRFATSTRPAADSPVSAFVLPGPLPLALDHLNPWHCLKSEAQ